MRVADNEFSDPAVHEPRVTGAPEAIWLVYGDLEHDDTHANCCASGDVTWCEDAQFSADVRYTRTDLVAERVRAAVAAERERRLALAADLQEYLYRVGSQVQFEHAQWAQERGVALLAALKT